MVAAAVIGGAAISAGASMMSSSEQADSAEAAAAAQGDATALSVMEQRRQFDLTREDLAPYREIGSSALTKLAALYGVDRVGPTGRPGYINTPQVEMVALKDRFKQLGPGEHTIPGYGTYDVVFRDGQFAGADKRISGASSSEAGPYGDFQETPGYQFAFDEGLRALDRSAAARGRLQGGGYGRELTRYGQGMANQEFNTYANRLASLAGVGQQATTAGAQFGAQTAAGIGNTLMTGAQAQGNALQNAGTARASGYAGVGNAINAGANNYMFYNALKGMGRSGGYSMIPVA